MVTLQRCDCHPRLILVPSLNEQDNSPLGNDEGMPDGKLGAPGILGVAKATTGVARGTFEVLRLTCEDKSLDMHTMTQAVSLHRRPKVT